MTDIDTINPDLQPGKPVQTRSGLEAVSYAVHEGQEHPIHGAYKNEKGEWVVLACHADGSVWDGNPGPTDLIPVPKKLTGFINVYPCTVYETREEAGRAADNSWPGHRIACLDLAEHNLTEGHGLTEGLAMDEMRCEKCGQFMDPQKAGASWAVIFDFYPPGIREELIRCSACTSKKGPVRTNARGNMSSYEGVQQ